MSSLSTTEPPARLARPEPAAVATDAAVLVAHAPLPAPQAVTPVRDDVDEAPVAGLRTLFGWATVGLLLITAVVAALAWWAGPDAIRDAVARMSTGWVGVAIIAELVALACLTQVQVATFRVTSGHLPRLDAAVVALGSFSLSQLLPAGGAAGGVFAARRLARHTDGVTATASAALAAACSLVMLGTVVTVGGLLSASVGSGDMTVAVVTGAASLALVAVVVVVALLLADPSRRLRVVAWVADRTGRGPAARKDWLEALERQVAVLRRPGRLAPGLGWAALAWTLDVAVLAAIVQAVGLPVSIAGTIAAYGVANLANAVPLTPGGIGLVEAGLAGTFVALGADPGAAAATALGYRLVGDMLPVVATLPVLVADRHLAGPRRA